MAQGTRQQRVGNAMRELLTELIVREVKDPRVHAAGLISVSQVEINRDLSVAYVYVSFIGGPGDARAEERALAGLTAAAGFLRGPVGRRMSLQRAPELRFLRDARASFGQHMRDIMRDDEQRAADAGPEQTAGAGEGEPGEGESGEDEPGEDEPGEGGPGDGEGEDRGGEGAGSAESGQKRDEPGS
jgi:ribosome-binding factor A